MSDIPWRIAIERALTTHGGDPVARWVQLATVSPDGWPSVRTVVFRGFVGRGPVLRFTTDLRTAKVGQIAREPRSEACWLFPESREQFRLAGELRLVGPEEADPGWLDERAEAWASMPQATRLGFAWPDPGAPLADLRRFRVPAPDPTAPPDTFALLLLDPVRVDHVDLRSDPHSRVIHERLGGDPDDREAGRWASRPVNP